ncbi:hypothetical protein Q8F57_007645 [Paraburkholderia terrae]|uniref:hypothetical protein n=1 Tax=Paraburkholderia terrae TaxID=311230 RepID=UPI00296B4AA4|nr:hypothetical protein [Paraburkholderia terrae]MDW3663298.1 hypothetical protein [Paraburkholderia terrae]
MTTSHINQLLQQIASLQLELNDERFLELRLYRRDTVIYELSSAVNHTIACWLSKNYRPVSILIERGRNFIRETPAGRPEAVAYYALAEEFFSAVQSALESIPHSKA